jgi:hypothetical protein
MALPKKVWKKSRFEKAIGNLNSDGMFWWSQNIDLEKTPPYIRVSHKLFKNLDIVAQPQLDSMPIDGALFGKYFGGTGMYNWMMIQGWGTAPKWFRYEYPNWVHVHTYYFTGRAYSMLGDSQFNSPVIGTEQGFLYFTVGNALGRYNASNDTWNDNFQSLGSGVLFSQGNVPLAKFLKYIVAGFNNMICTWDTVNLVWAGNPNPPKLTLPQNFDVRWFAVLTDWLVIGAHDLTSNGSALFFWDGVSGTYNRVLRIPNVSCPVGVVDKNRLYVITGDGWINYFDGSGLVKLNRFPDIETGDVSFYINQNAVKVHNGVILIGKRAHGFNMEKRYYAGGIWVYNPSTNALYFRNTMSHNGITNISGYGVIDIGSIQLTPNSDQYFVGWDKGGGSDRYLLDSNNDTGTYRPYNWNAIIVSPIFDDEPYRRKRFIQEVINFWRPLINTPFARYVVKYNTTEKYQKYANFASGGSNTYFTVSFGIGNFEVGDEVTVVAGSGAGQIRHIKSIDTALNRVYVDETLYVSDTGNTYDSTSYILVTPFKLAGVIKGSDNPQAINKLVRFNARAKKIQIKVEIWSPSGFVGEWDMGIRDMSTIYIPDRTIK